MNILRFLGSKRFFDSTFAIVSINSVVVEMKQLKVGTDILKYFL